MPLPSSRDWIYSVKTFAASMLALYLALKFQLPRPYWAMASVYIASNPFVGATTSKALYRSLGTLLGASAAVFLLPPLGQTPMLFSLAIAVWMGVMLYLAISDRTAKSYVFLLAGYTLPLIALPTVNNPATVFDVAIARFEEITLGVICAAVVNTLILPSKLAPVLAERTIAWFDDAAFYAAEALGGRATGQVLSDTRQRMAATINALELLLSQLSHDGTRPDVLRKARELHGRMSVLLPIISALADPLRVFRQSALPAEAAITRVVDDVLGWIDDTRHHPGDHDDAEIARGAARLQAAFIALEPSADTLKTWEGAIVSSVLWRLRLLVELWQDCVTLQHAIAADRRDPFKPAFRHWRFGGTEPFFDRGIMLFSTISAISAVFVACMLWIVTGWQDGAGGASLAAVACCFFAALDDPAPSVFKFFTSTAASVVVAGLYIFVVLPQVHDFPMLVVLFAVPFILVGTLIPQPRFALATMLVAVNTATFISIQSAYDSNVELFLNSNLSGLVGLVFAYVWTRVTRPFGADLAARRIIASSWRDLVAAASPHEIEAQRPMAARMFDRLMQLLPRLGSSDSHAHPSVDSLRDLRIGLNTLDLQVERDKVRPSLRSAIDHVLREVRLHFERCLAHGGRIAPPAALLTAIDVALDGAVNVPTEVVQRDSMHALVSLRLAAFPNTAPPFHPHTSMSS